MATKETVLVVIECANANTFSAYTTEKFDGFTLIGYGISAEEAKQDFIESYKEAREYYGCPELDFSFKYDAESFLQLYRSKMSLAGLQIITGINQKQLNHYLTGHRKPSATTTRKIADSVHRFGLELSQLEFV